MNIPGWMPVTIYAIIVLGFIGIYTWHHLDDSAGRRPLVALTVLVAFQLATDCVSRFYEYSGVPMWLIVACTYINFAALPLIGVSWHRFVCKVLAGGEGTILVRANFVVYVLAAIGIVPLLANPFTGCVFYFDEASIYHRGILYFVPAASSGLCIAIAELYLLARTRMLGWRAILVLVLFPVPPLLGGIAASLVYGLPWMPLGISLSMVMLFASTFASGMNTDYLTSVINRRRIEELLADRIEAARNGKPFAGLMVDIDDFKEINDTLGHLVGDRALSDTAQLLKESLRGIDVVGRFGGDEFFALLDVANEEELDMVVSRIRDGEVRIGEEGRPFPLRLSKGYAMFDPGRFADAAAFEEHLDALMYANKQQHKLECAGAAGTHGAKVRMVESHAAE